MSATKYVTAKKEFSWTPPLIKRLRGKRTLEELGRLIQVPKNTVWRWEAGYVKPDTEHAGRLSQLAEREHFLEDWELAGSAVIVGDLESANKRLRGMLNKSLARSVRTLRK